MDFVRHRAGGTGAALVALALMAASCSREGARAVREPQTGEAKDYRAMIERSRQRNQVERTRQQLLRAVESFQVDLGRMPTNLYELVLRGYVNDIPDLPDDMAYEYVPSHGYVRIRKLAPDPFAGSSQPSAPADAAPAGD